MHSRTAVVIPAFNAGHLIDETIASVRMQTSTPCEVVAIDDGSTDGTADRLRGLGVRTISQANSGTPAARNVGRAALRTDPAYLLFLDQDDLLEPTMIQTLETHLDRNPSAGIAYGRLQVIDGAGVASGYGAWPPRHAPGSFGRPRRVADDEPLTPMLSIVDLTAIVPAAALVRASIFDAIGGWDVTLERGGAEDTTLAVEVALRSGVHYVDTLVVRYRIHDSQESNNTDRLRSVQQQLHDRLRGRSEPLLREALRARDQQVLVRRSLDALRRARTLNEVKSAARYSAGVAKLVVKSLR